MHHPKIPHKIEGTHTLVMRSRRSTPVLLTYFTNVLTRKCSESRKCSRKSQMFPKNRKCSRKSQMSRVANVRKCSQESQVIANVPKSQKCSRELQMFPSWNHASTIGDPLASMQELRCMHPSSATHPIKISHTSFSPRKSVTCGAERLTTPHGVQVGGPPGLLSSRVRSGPPEGAPVRRDSPYERCLK